MHYVNYAAILVHHNRHALSRTIINSCQKPVSSQAANLLILILDLFLFHCVEGASRPWYNGGLISELLKADKTKQQQHQGPSSSSSCSSIIPSEHQPHSRGAGPEAHIPAKRAGWPSHPTAAGSTGGRTRASHLPGRGRVGVGLHRLQGIRSSSTQGLPLHPPLPWRTAPRPRLSLQLSRHSHCH